MEGIASKVAALFAVIDSAIAGEAEQSHEERLLALPHTLSH